MSNAVTSRIPPPPPHAITIEWSIAPVTGVQNTSLPPTGSTSFSLQPSSPRSSSTNPTPISPNTPTQAGPPSPRTYNQEDSAHYTLLLSSLSQAKDTLNARLTEWKELVGDREKIKEVLPPGTAGKQGMGKAMMMVQAARQVDGRVGGGGGDAGGGGSKEQKGNVVGLPTDDQESDSDEGDELVIPE